VITRKRRAFDAAEEEGGAEGEDHVGRLQRLLHRRHGLLVVGRHPRLRRLHGPVADAAAPPSHPRHHARRRRKEGTGAATPPQESRKGNDLRAALLRNGRRAQGERKWKEAPVLAFLGGNLRPQRQTGARRKDWRLAVQAVLWKTSYTLRWLVNPAAALPPRARVLAGAEEKGGGVEDKRGERRRFRCFLPSFLVGLFFARELTARSKATICFVWVSSELSVGPLACAGGGVHPEFQTR
jgi:hypothetical protein